MYGISNFIGKSLAVDKTNDTKLLVAGNTKMDIAQKQEGAFIGSAVVGALPDSLITDTPTDGDIQMVKTTANDVRTTKLGITTKSDNGKLFS